MTLYHSEYFKYIPLDTLRQHIQSHEDCPHKEGMIDTTEWDHDVEEVRREGDLLWVLLVSCQNHNLQHYSSFVSTRTTKMERPSDNHLNEREFSH